MNDTRTAPDVRFVLCDTSHPGNVGAVARAMKTMGLSELALVAPAEFPHPEAEARAAGAADLLARARVHAALEPAIADRTLVVATSSRRRSVSWPELSPRALAERIAAGTERCAVLFGAERTGLTNEQLARASHLVVIPADPVYPSLNLAAAAQIIAYEVRVAAIDAGAAVVPTDAEPAASAGEVEAYFARLERALAGNGFLDQDNPRQLMQRLRRLYHRAGLSENDVRILHGMLGAFEDR